MNKIVGVSLLSMILLQNEIILNGKVGDNGRQEMVRGENRIQKQIGVMETDLDYRYTAWERNHKLKFNPIQLMHTEN